MNDQQTTEVPPRLLERAESLTPLPAAVTRLAQVIQDAGSTAEEIGDMVRQDPVVAAAVLREANSSWVAARSEISTIERAFVLLGRARLLMLAMKGYVDDQFHPALPQYGLAQGQLWQHSVASATAAGIVRDFSKVELGGEVLTAALLHDLAKMVLCEFVDMSQLDEAMLQLPLSSVERIQTDVDHAQLGAAITRRWGLPASICDAIGFHHTASHEDAPVAAHGVVVADAVAHEALGEDVGGFFGVVHDAVEASMSALGIEPSSWEAMVAETQETITAST